MPFIDGFLVSEHHSIPNGQLLRHVHVEDEPRIHLLAAVGASERRHAATDAAAAGAGRRTGPERPFPHVGTERSVRANQTALPAAVPHLHHRHCVAIAQELARSQRRHRRRGPYRLCAAVAGHFHRSSAEIYTAAHLQHRHWRQVIILIITLNQSINHC